MNQIILSGHQPNYLPYPGLFGKIMQSDKFIYVSNVQFEKKSWQNRNRIKGTDGEIVLTVPVQSKGRFDQKIKDVIINNNLDWRRKHFSSIQLNYKKTKYYHRYIDFFDDLYKKEWNFLNDLDIYITNWILDEFDCKTEIYYDTNYDFAGKSNDLLIEMTKELKCNAYLSNKGSQNYVDISRFTSNGLDHMYLDFQCPEYFQGKGEFISNLSIVDMLFRYGAEWTKNLILDKKNYVYSDINKNII